jgi:DNA-binding CsgD family transcriptional regulator
MSFLGLTRKDFFMQGTSFIGTETTPHRLFFVTPCETITEDLPPVEEQTQLLTDDQKIAIGLFAVGYTTNNAARKLGLTRGTFRSKVLMPALQALDARDKEDAVSIAYETGILHAKDIV